MAAVPLASAAAELANVTGGGFFQIGTSSALFSLAVVAGFQQLSLIPIMVPTLSEWAMGVLIALLLLTGILLMRRRRMLVAP